LAAGNCGSPAEERNSKVIMTLYLFCLATKGIFLLLVYGLRKLVQRGEIEMPSEKTLSAKKERVAQLVEMLKNSAAGVLVDYKGITVEEDTKLRRDLRAENVKYSVEKNSLLRFALKNAGIEGLDDVLEGTTAIAVSNEDQTAPARVLGKYASEMDGKFNLKAGMVDGEIYDEKGVVALSKIPAKDVLLAQLVGSLQGPIQGLAAILKAVADSKSEDAA
jgi:large subunit ribosomal protein L10